MVIGEAVVISRSQQPTFACGAVCRQGSAAARMVYVYINDMAFDRLLQEQVDTAVQAVSVHLEHFNREE